MTADPFNGYEVLAAVIRHSPEKFEGILNVIAPEGTKRVIELGIFAPASPMARGLAREQIPKIKGITKDGKVQWQ